MNFSTRSTPVYFEMMTTDSNDTEYTIIIIIIYIIKLYKMVE